MNNQNPNPNPVPPSPNAQPKPQPVPITRDQIKKRCHARLGIEADELDTLYPKDEDLLLFYTDTVLKMSSLDGSFEGETTPEPEDSYKLSAKEKNAVEGIKLEQKRQARKNKDKQEKVEKRAEAEFEKAGAHLPPESKVSFAEARAAMKALME